MSSTANFLAADLGASGGRVMVGHWNGRKLSLKSLHRFSNAGVEAAGTLYWDALGIWKHLQDGLSKYRSHFTEVPRGIAVDAWGVDFALLDRAGRLLGNPVHYRDARTKAILSKALQKVDPDRLFSETGVQTSPINTLIQLYSMVESCDASVELAATLLMIPDLFLYFLCGVARSERSEASTTQMFSLRKGDWVRWQIEALGIPAHILPSVDNPGTIRGTVMPAVLRHCGIAETFPVIAVASHDTASAVAAIPNLDSESVFISSGTWSLMGIQVDQPNTSAETMRMGFTNEAGAEGALLLRNLTGFWILQECLRHWEVSGLHYDWNEITKAALSAPRLCAHIDPDAAPFQSPGNMPKAIHDYCIATHQQPPITAGAIARCVFESLCLKYRWVLQSIEMLAGRQFKTIRLVGGGARNHSLCQMIADCCDRPLVGGPVEASALGNVLLQAIATGHLENLEQGQIALCKSVRTREFAPHCDAAWDDAFASFESLLKL